jgi:energy-coupling factor transporter ATP-binding protein EcfA2
LLGKAIGRHLENYSGRLYVEFPERMGAAAAAVADTINAAIRGGAVLVTVDAANAGEFAATPGQALAWRTDHSRVFVWAGTDFDPDTGFRSAVEPFISRSFPVGCRCDLGLLARLGAEALVDPTDPTIAPAVKQNFVEVADAALRFLEGALSEAPDTPSEPGILGVIRHWDRALDELGQDLGAIDRALRPSDAMQIFFRLGLPAPPSAYQGVTLQGERLFSSEAEAREQGQRWARWCAEALPDRTAREQFQARLEARAGASGGGAWSGLSWGAEHPSATPFEAVRRTLASAEGLQGFTGLPERGDGDPKAWWTLSAADAVQAAGHQAKWNWLPTEGGDAKASAAGSVVLLLTERAAIEGTSRGRDLVLENVTFDLSGPERAIHLSDTPPPAAEDGDTWIQPGTLDVKGQRFQVRSPALVLEQGVLRLSVGVRAPITGSPGKPQVWNPFAKLSASFRASERHNGNWLPPAPVQLAAKVIVPSPFSPTVYVTEGANQKPVETFPSTDVGFAFDGDGWAPAETRDLQLPTKGAGTCLIYRATLAAPNAPSLSAQGDVAVGALRLADGVFGPVEQHLNFAEGDAIVWGASELAVFRAAEGELLSSSGLLRAIRREQGGRVDPPAEALDEIRGLYEQRLCTHVGRVLADGAALGLGHLVVSARGAPPAQDVPAFGEASLEVWLGGGEVPPFSGAHLAAVQHLPEYQAFADAAQEVAGAYGAGAAGAKLLSAWSYSGLTRRQIVAFSEAHRRLAEAASRLGAWERMLARFPFSIFVLERINPQASALRVAAVLMSPMHPARLAWAWGVAHAAATTTEAQLPARLLELAEGWNIPCSTGLPNPAEVEELAVAQPLEQGAGDTFAAWSGLVAVVQSQSSPPPTSLRAPLPWAGQAGVTEGALKRALADYKAVHPYGETIAVALDALQPVPRSSAIDDAVIKLLGDEAGGGFPGGVEVWDSKSRQGSPPRRQQLLKRRSEGQSYPGFTWRSVAEDALPPRVDFRVFEAIETTTAHEPSRGLGGWGPWPLRRFAVTTFNGATTWLARDQAIAPGVNDEFGLAALLKEIEFTQDGTAAAVRIRMPSTLGREQKASRWTVLGDLHLHPSVLAEYASRQAGQLLWEWRTGWMGMGRSASPGERSYYVTSEVPASFRRGLASRQALTDAQVDELLTDLGRRGIGLASMFNGGRPQERGAMGFFYAFRLLFPPSGASPPAAWLNDGEVHAVLPVDAVNPILEGLAGPGHHEESRNRADFVLLVLRLADERLDITAVPIEVKHRGSPSKPSPLSPADAAHARTQVRKTRELLEAIGRAFGDPDAPPVAAHARRNALALLLELGLGLSPRPQPAEATAELLRRVLWSQLTFRVATGAVFTFLPGAFGTPLLGVSAYSISREDSVFHVTMDPKALPGFFWDGAPVVSADARDQLDAALLQLATSAAIAGEAGTPDFGRDDAGEEGGGAPAAPSPPDGSGGSGAAAELPQDGGSTPAAAAAPNPSTAEAAPEAKGTEAEPEPVPPLQEIAPRAVATAAAAGEAPLDATPSIIGSSAASRRWATIGRNERGHPVALDLEQTHAVGVFGYMGSGKSYFLNTLIEGAVEPLGTVNALPQPLAVVVFNYRQSAHDRFEYSSLCFPNDNPSDADALRGYGVAPTALHNVQVLALPNQLTDRRLAEYGPASSSELAFNPANLSLEDWMLLMGEPGHQRVYAQTITAVLRDLEKQRVPVTLEAIEEALQADDIPAASRKAGELRLRFLREYVSQSEPTDFSQIVRPGSVTVFDLRANLFNKHDALRFFLVCANQIGNLRGFNKLVVFDEAHEYMSAEFEEKISSRIRNMRHEGASYVFATQDVESLPDGILKFLDTAFVFGMGTARNQADLAAAIGPMRELGDRVLRIEKGQCYAWCQSSQSGLYAVPRKLSIRPRVTRHGGVTQTFLD